MSKILITGASGFIGGHIVSAVLDAGHEAVCLVRPGSDRRALLARGVQLASGDMRDAASLSVALQGVDGVIHAAAMLKAPWRRDFEEANVGGTRNLARACAARTSPPPLVIVSSLAAAGPAPDETPRTEAWPALPVSLYGRVKRDAERAAAALAAELPVTIVRPPMVFGEGDRSALTLFRHAQSGWHLVPGRVDHVASMIHAADLAALLHAALLRGERLAPGGGDGPGCYYAAADETPRLSEIGRLIAEALDRPPPRVLRTPLSLLWLVAALGELRGRLSDMPQLMNLDKARELSSGPWQCSAQKARRELGFVPLALPLRLRQTARWYREQGWLPAGRPHP
ncbi:MAG TPA: NAD-dependent epimerase/dehydratase family protein [Solimonas sp.]